MKETHYFLVPDAANNVELPADEAQHALKVLRLGEGDEVVLIDREGNFHKARLTSVGHDGCRYEIIDSASQPKGWEGRIHLAIAPTKNMDRIEWMAEKCTEIGIDEMTFLDCRRSERRRMRTDRVIRVVEAAVKQSRKPFVPIVNEMIPFDEFIHLPLAGTKYICHCYEEIERSELPDELAAIQPAESVTVMVGPEGDFTIEEVRDAVRCGFKSVALGTFRLRTETAGVMAVSMYSLAHRNKKTI
ncbi:MAG: 16S rRNA (uracil(1498)-N(3))-methyltransferase [Prevotella sp.]|nr:16S rRNA (uracil(1498)-N(3))-methyltransferase [Prevotella sp.]